MQSRENSGTAQGNSSARNLALALAGAVAITAGVTLLGDAPNLFKALYPLEQQYFGDAKNLWASSVSAFLVVLYVLGTIAFVRLSNTIKYNQRFSRPLDIKRPGRALPYAAWVILATLVLLRAPLGVTGGPLAADFSESVWAVTIFTLIANFGLYFVSWAVTSSTGAPLEDSFGEVKDTPLADIALLGTLPSWVLVYNGFSAFNLGLVLGLAFFSRTLVKNVNEAIAAPAASAEEEFVEVRDGKR